MADVQTMDGAPPDDGMTIEGTTGAEELLAPKEYLPPSKLPVGQQFDVLMGWFRGDADHSRTWRRTARDAFAFRSGEQWTDDDRAMLEDAKRPVIVFNRVLTILKAVAGMEINGRHEISFLPRGTEDTKPNEVLTAASRWMADSCDGEDEESQAFDNCCTTGMGFCEERMSYEDDPAGLYVEDCTDPREMYWDRAARKKNLADAKRMARARRMSLGDAVAMFPGKSREQLDARWAEDMIGDQSMGEHARSIEQKRRRNGDDDSMAFYDDQVEVLIVQMQWIEREVYWIVGDPMTNTKSELADNEYRRLVGRMQKLGIPLHAARMTRKVYKQAWLGSEMLKTGPAPIKGQFTWKCITGEHDAVTGTWFGLVKVLRDPQMWANKWLSQILHILNTTAKGGVLAELSAFDDPRQAEDTYAQPEQITWVADGALSGQKPKIMPKAGQGMTDAYLGLLTFAISSFKDVSGINLELLGQQDQNQPGVLEAMRKQAGMTVLATLFDSLRRFRKQIGRTRLFYVQNFLSDGRLIRVVGPDSRKAVRLLKDTTFGEYDVVIDDTPTSPNQKEANWLIIQPLLAIFKDQLVANPEVFAMLLEYSPLPARIVEAIKAFIQKSGADPEVAQNKKLAVAGAIAIINKDQSIAELNNKKAGATEATAMYDIAMAQNLLADNKFNELKGHLSAMAEMAKAQTAQADVEKTRVQAVREAAGIQHDATDAETRRMAEHNKAAKLAVDAGHTTVDHHHARVGLMIDHLGALSGVHRDAAAAAKDHAIARRTEREPIAPAGAK